MGCAPATSRQKNISLSKLINKLIKPNLVQVNRKNKTDSFSQKNQNISLPNSLQAKSVSYKNIIKSQDSLIGNSSLVKINKLNN